MTNMRYVCRLSLSDAILRVVTRNAFLVDKGDIPRRLVAYNLRLFHQLLPTLARNFPICLSQTMAGMERPKLC